MVHSSSSVASSVRSGSESAALSRRSSVASLASSDGDPRHVDEILDIYAGFELSTRTQLGVGLNNAQAPRAGATAPAPKAPAAPAAAADAGREAPRGILYRCVRKLWDVALVKPLQLVAAALGLLVGIVFVVVEATFDVFCHMGSQILGAFLVAFEYVHGASPARSIPKQRPRSSQTQRPVARPQTPTPLATPDRGGRTPSLPGSSPAPATPTTVLGLQKSRQPTPSAQSEEETMSEASALGAARRSSPDAIEKRLPEATLVTLPTAICVTCRETVGPNQACAHIANEKSPTD